MSRKKFEYYDIQLRRRIYVCGLCDKELEPEQINKHIQEQHPEVNQNEIYYNQAGQMVWRRMKGK